MLISMTKETGEVIVVDHTEVSGITEGTDSTLLSVNVSGERFCIRRPDLMGDDEFNVPSLVKHLQGAQK